MSLPLIGDTIHKFSIKFTITIKQVDSVSLTYLDFIVVVIILFRQLVCHLKDSDKGTL